MKQTKFMQVMFSAVENGDEELTGQVANDIETAKSEGAVDTDEVSYNNLGNGKVLIVDKVNGEATIAEMPEDEAATYDLIAVPDEELDKFLYPAEDGVTPNEGVHDFVVEDEHAPIDNEEAPNIEENAGCEDHIDQDDQMGEQHQFSVSTDNEVVLRIFSDVEFYDRIFSETLDSDETSVVGDLKVEKIDDDTVVVTSESTGDQAKVVLDGDEMEVTELDQKEMSYSDYEDEEPALYSVILDEDEMNLYMSLFSEEDPEDEDEVKEDGSVAYADEEGEPGIDEGQEGYNPLYVVGIDADNHQIVDAPVYSEEDAQELVEHLTEIGVDGVNVFEDPAEARDYADQLVGDMVGTSEVEEFAEPEEHEFSDYTVYTTRFFTADDYEYVTNFMQKVYSESEIDGEDNQDKIKDAIEDGEQIETSDEIITPVDSETAVVEDKKSGEFTKATLDEEGVDLEAIDEEEAEELTDKVEVSEDNDEDEEEKEYSVSDEFEYVTNFAMRLYSDDEDAHENVEDAIESGEEVETDTEVITPIDSETAVVEDKESGEYTKVTIDEDGGKDTEHISKEEAEELFSYIEIEPTDMETSFATATRFFADAMAPQQMAPQGAPAPQMDPQMASQMNPDPNAMPVDENGNPIDPSQMGGDPAVQSVEAIEDKALVAVQSIQAAANDAVMAIQQAKEAPAPGQEQDLQEAQFSEYYEDDERFYSEGDTLTNWLRNI